MNKFIRLEYFFLKTSKFPSRLKMLLLTSFRRLDSMAPQTKANAVSILSHIDLNHVLTAVYKQLASEAINKSFIANSIFFGLMIICVVPNQRISLNIFLSTPLFFSKSDLHSSCYCDLKALIVESKLSSLIMFMVDILMLKILCPVLLVKYCLNAPNFSPSIESLMKPPNYLLM